MEDVDLGVCAGRWYPADPDRVAVVLPGARYLPFAPHRWFAREVAAARGWSVLEVWDEYLDRSVDPRHWVGVRAEAALARAGSGRVLLVTKSLSSVAVHVRGRAASPRHLADAAPQRRGGRSRVRRPRRAVTPRRWNSRRVVVAPAARRTGHDVLELEGADHSLQVPGDPLGAIDALRRVVERMDAFVAALDA